MITCGGKGYARDPGLTKKHALAYRTCTITGGRSLKSHLTYPDAEAWHQVGSIAGFVSGLALMQGHPAAHCRRWPGDSLRVSRGRSSPFCGVAQAHSAERGAR